MQITVSVKGADLVAKGLANIRAEIPRISETTIKKAADAIVKRMQVYPPQRTGSRYTRTFKFQGAWSVTRSATGWTVANSAPYGRYVVGDASGRIGGGGQAWMHVGRWLLFRDVAEYEITQVGPMIQEHIRIKARSEGLA